MKQANLCKYSGLKDELIYDRLMSGIKDDRTREKLLSKKDLTLTRTIELLKTSEATQLQVQDMTTTEQESASTVQAITKSQRKQNENTSRQAESAVKTCKALLKKAQLARSDINLALLNHRNTPTEPTNLSPAQRLFG